MLTRCLHNPRRRTAYEHKLATVDELQKQRSDLRQLELQIKVVVGGGGCLLPVLICASDRET